MAATLLEQRAIRLGVSTYLATAGWTEINFNEGWSEVDITNPLVNIYTIDAGKVDLELGRYGSQHAQYNRVLQADVYMESESRAREMCEDIMKYLDIASIEIKDYLASGVVVGYISFPDSESIVSAFIPPTLNNPDILRWRGVTRGAYEAYYPNNGNPF